MHIASCHLSELKVSGNIGRDKDIGQLSTGHEELGDEVDVPVVDAAILRPWFLPLIIVSVLLEELADVREYSQIRYRRVLTVSMLTEAASLFVVSGGYKVGGS